MPDRSIRSPLSRCIITVYHKGFAGAIGVKGRERNLVRPIFYGSVEPYSLLGHVPLRGRWRCWSALQVQLCRRKLTDAQADIDAEAAHDRPPKVALPAYTTDFCPLKRQIVHESSGIEDNAYDRASNLVRIN
jgi:hypothetical protein